MFRYNFRKKECPVSQNGKHDWVVLDRVLEPTFPKKIHDKFRFPWIIVTHPNRYILERRVCLFCEKVQNEMIEYFEIKNRLEEERVKRIRQAEQIYREWEEAQKNG